METAKDTCQATYSEHLDSVQVRVQVKGEQDAAIRQAEEQAALKHRFRANPLPKSTTQPRWVLRQASKQEAGLHEPLLCKHWAQKVCDTGAA